MNPKMKLNAGNQRTLDAVSAQMLDPNDPASSAQLAAFQRGLANQQEVGDKAAEEAMRIQMQQAALVRALRAKA